MTDNQDKQDKKDISIDGGLTFERGCKSCQEYVPGQKLLDGSACKLNQFDWLKDY